MSENENNQNHKEVAKQYLHEEVGKHGVRWMNSRYAEPIFAFISFVESAIVPIIIDPFLVALILFRRELWLRYIAIAIIFSILGGICGYLIGWLFYDWLGSRIIETYGLQESFTWVVERVDANAFVFVLLGALTPIPYKLVAIASGVLTLNPFTFLVASIIGRTLRLGLVGWATYLVGPRAVPLVRRHLLKLAYGLAALLILYIVIRVFF